MEHTRRTQIVDKILVLRALKGKSHWTELGKEDFIQDITLGVKAVAIRRIEINSTEIKGKRYFKNWVS